MWSTGETSEFAELALGDVTRDDSQRRFWGEHSVEMLEQCCKHSKQCRNNVAMLRCAKNRLWESSLVTSPLGFLANYLSFVELYVITETCRYHRREKKERKKQRKVNHFSLHQFVLTWHINHRVNKLYFFKTKCICLSAIN